MDWSRRRMLEALCASAGTICLAACTSSVGSLSTGTAAPVPAATPTSAAATAPAATPVVAIAATSAPTPPATVSAGASAGVSASGDVKRGGTLRAAMVGDLTSIDGQQSLPGVTATVGNAYETLTRYDDNLQPQPVLAESWDLSGDGKQIKVNLRKGVQYQDGRELTSDDVSYSLMRVRNPQLAAVAGQLASQSAWWTSVDTPDKYTIVLASDVPRPGVFDFFQYLTIVDKNLMDGPDVKSRANGTGAFAFVEWVPGDHVSMTRNANYWKTGLPYVDGLQTRIFRDAQAMVASLEAGAVDETDAPGLLDLVRLKADPKYQALVVAASGQFVCIVANTTLAPTDNKQFRQAINYAIDRKRFVDTVFQGIITDGQDLPFPPRAPAFDAERNQRYTFDLDKAKSLLQASGVTGADIELVYSNTTFGDLNQTLAQILQADLASIGVNLRLHPVDFQTQFDVASKRGYQGLLLSAGSSANLAEASSFLTRSRFYSPDAKNSFTGLDSADYTRLIGMAATEPDAARRKDLYGQINDIILDESMAMAVSLYPQTALASANVHALSYDSRPGLTFATAWLA
jgi:peptide/nickel transport system substrate-binding protein